MAQCSKKKRRILFLLFSSCEFFRLSFHLRVAKNRKTSSFHQPTQSEHETKRKSLFFRSVCSVSFSNGIKMLPRIENNIIVYKTFQCDFVTRKKSIQFYTHTHTSEKAHTIFDQTLMQEKKLIVQFQRMQSKETKPTLLPKALFKKFFVA